MSDMTVAHYIINNVNERFLDSDWLRTEQLHLKLHSSRTDPGNEFENNNMAKNY